MANDSKLRALIQTWTDYIWFADLTNAEVDAGKEEQNCIWDKDVTLLGDQLRIEEPLFKELKQQFKEFKNKGKSNEFQVAVAFPQIYLIKDGSRKFRPLFTQDISTIFQDSYRPNGWDLTEFEFQPVLPNLIDFEQLDELEVENLVTREGLKVFLENTFKRPFSTLQDFTHLIELPPAPVRSKPLPYLLRFDLVPYNRNLKKDFQKILSQPKWDWAVPDHPASEYLWGRPKPPRHEVLFLGAFPTHPPTASQALALKHAQSNPITAVIGPPGNGKTTLLLHKIATQVVKRAVQLAQTGVDDSNLTLVTSTNNRAVVNVEQRLTQDFPSDRFYLSGGAKDLITQQVLPKLQATIDWLQRETFDETECQIASQQILSHVAQLNQQLQQSQLNLLQRADDTKRLEEVIGEVQLIDERISLAQIEPRSQLPANEPDYSQFPLEAYQQIQPHLERAKQSLPRFDDSQSAAVASSWSVRLRHWLIKLWQKLTKTSTRHIINRLRQQIATPVMATLATPFPFQIPLTRESLVAARDSVPEQLEAATQWHNRQQEFAARPSQMDSLQQQKSELVAEQQLLLQRLADYPTEDFYAGFFIEFHPLQQQLFTWSWNYLQQSALRRKGEVIASLMTYIDVLNGEWNAMRRFGQEWRTIYRDLSLLFPVITSTLQSVRNLLPYPDSGCIDQLIVDEAGMILQHQLFPALVRCRQALVVGDPWQLEPVVSLSDETLSQYRLTAFVKRELTDDDYDRYSPVANSTAYHRAAGASGQGSDLGGGIILKEHYRCVPSIITFCDRLCNYDLEIKTPAKQSALGPNLIAYHVNGNYHNHTNPEEISATEAIIKHLLAYGYCINSPNNELTIGVISPYRRQALALQSELQSRWKNFRNDSIGTIHTFQGGEKSVILLSTRQCRDSDRLWFINRKPNLLNVAVSRAQELFILVGNLERLKEGGYTRLLVEHIQQYGEIRSLP